MAIENLKKSKLSNKAWFDKSKRLRPETAIIYENDLGLLHDTKLDNQYTDKLADKWGGPYRVLKILDGGAYVLIELDGAELDGAYAGNRLKKYWLRSTQKEIEKEVEKSQENLMSLISQKIVAERSGLCPGVVSLFKFHS